MPVPELKSSYRHPPSPKELGEMKVKSSEKNNAYRKVSVGKAYIFFTKFNLQICGNYLKE